MEQRTGTMMVHSLMILVIMLAVACGKNNDSPDMEEPFTVTLPDMDSADQTSSTDMPEGMDADLGGAPDMRVEPADLGSDMSEEMGEEDMPADMPIDPDPDGDGVEGDADNCPDEANADQADRDRDGVGDVCDEFPRYHDPSNPDALDEQDEDEASGLNDDAVTSEQLGYTLPFAVSAAISPVEEGQPDLDIYSIEVDRPTALLVEIEYRSLVPSTAMYPAMILTGYGLSTVSVFRVASAPAQGTSALREVFLPVPGKYALIVSDIRNFIDTQANVGSNNWNYKLRVSEVPLPEPSPLTVPGPPMPHEHDGQLAVFEVDAASLGGAIRAQSNPANFGGGTDPPFFQPVISLYDPDAQETLAHTLVDQLDDNNAVTLDSFVAQDRQRLWIVEDYGQRDETQVSNMVMAAQPVTLFNETETLEAPQDDRLARAIWLDDGAQIQGAIDTPRGEDMDVEDVDLYLFTMSRGEVARVSITPTAGGSLEPSLDIGNAFVQGGLPSFYSLHRSEPAFDSMGPTDPRAVSFLVSAEEQGDMAVEVRHANQPRDMVVGGAPFGYALTFERLDPVAMDVPTLPAEVLAPVEEGSSALLAFTPPQDGIFSVNIERNNLFLNTRLLDSDFRLVEQTYNDSVTSRSIDGGLYYLDMRDFNGRASIDPLDISITSVAISDAGPLPAVVSDALIEEAESDYWKVTVPAGQLFSLKIHAPNFLPDVEIFEEDGFERIGGTTSSYELLFEEETSLVVRVSSYDDARGPDQTYDLGMRLVTPAPLGALPAQRMDLLDEQPFSDWYAFPVTAGRFYSISVSSTNPSFRAQARIIRADTLGYIAGTSNGRARFSAPRTETVYLRVYDSDNEGGADFDYDLSVAELIAAPLAPGATATGAQLPDGQTEAIFTVSLPRAGALGARATTSGWTPRIQFLSSGSLFNLGGRQSLESLWYATSDTTNLVVSVSSLDGSLTGPLDFDLTLDFIDPTSATPEVEPNDTTATAMAPASSPAVIDGSIGPPDLEDYYALDLVAGQRVWAMLTDRDLNGIYNLDMEVDVRDASDALLDTDRYGGEGFFPAVYGVQVSTSGRYYVRAALPTNSLDDGAYRMYIVVSDANEIASAEPNDTAMTAQDIGALDDAAFIQASVDMADPVDAFTFTTSAPGVLNISLRDASPGHELVLFDEAGAIVGAAGASHDMAQEPVIVTPSPMPAGRYTVELSAGAASGAANVVILRQ